MARGRPRKRNSRMDAAIDAMTREMGFDERLVRATVKELLKVYGVRGSPDQGWPFIEEFSYKLLIEQLLEKQEDGAENRDAAPLDDAAPPDNAVPPDDAAPLGDAAPSDDAAPYDDADDASSAVGPSSIVILPTFSGAVDSKLQTQDACDSTSQNNGLIHALLIKTTGAKECLPVDTLALRRRKPCYGWAFSNDGEGPVELKSGPLPESVIGIMSIFDANQCNSREENAHFGKPLEPKLHLQEDSERLSAYDNLELLKNGLPGALVTASVLGIHELSHVLVAKNTGVVLGVPYFVPSWQVNFIRRCPPPPSSSLGLITSIVDLLLLTSVGVLSSLECWN
ncbi:uncharacterized protein LOC110768923 isoform X3 [Prunus avium]|uniref:Uncharacterized protein LOC110768923 isoform X2 n=1 Tax=Prunus avium TaxID=42229 RepID=A0A6P5TN49_PRUAV|nr:uncharacterized protein LOC110768923 isoform X2 [Prunus avium]XP_021828489.1 uncharacterized protein LOC110768923 isoform X3 [Prunus avium]